MSRYSLRFAICMALLLQLIAFTVQAEDKTPLRFLVVDGDTLWFTEPIVIIGSRVPVALPGLLRSVSIVSAQDLQNRPARSIAEALGAVAEVEVRQRQLMGVQGDVSIRGSTFEQVQVLLDGVNVGDPQTGHHSKNLPVGMGEVARIEVLPGHGATLYGANAFGGVVNVVTRDPAEQRGGVAAVTTGEQGTLGGSLSLESGTQNILGGNWQTRVSAENFTTDGDRPGTDLENTTLSLRSRAKLELGELDVLTGFSSRRFGARDFYVPFDSEEQTDALFSMVRLRSDLGDRWTVEPTLAYRRHTDHFVLLRDNPEAYTNDHISRRASADLRASVEAGYGLAVAMGLEGAYEDIESDGIRNGVSGPALGDHERRRTSGGVEFVGRHDRLHWSLGTRLDAWTDMERLVSHSAAASWNATAALALRASAGNIHRIPTFTELYYADPANQGAADLASESGWTWDAGLDVHHGPWALGWSFFTRYEEDLIDWVKPSLDDAVWTATNILEGETRGWSQSASLETPAGHRFAVRYAGLSRSTTLADGWVGKYSSLSPRHRVTVEATAVLKPNLRLTPMLRAWERPDGEDDVVADLRLIWSPAAWDLALTVTNMFNVAYQEVPGVLLPGRLASGTMTLRF